MNQRQPKIFILAALIIGVNLAAAESGGEWTIRSPDTGLALVNPGMGWTLHFYSNVPKTTVPN
jgi:hypothetical protein